MYTHDQYNFYACKYDNEQLGERAVESVDQDELGQDIFHFMNLSSKHGEKFLNDERFVKQLWEAYQKLIDAALGDSEESQDGGNITAEYIAIDNAQRLRDIRG